MNCQQFTEEMGLYIINDPEVSALRAEVESHMAACPACRQNCAETTRFMEFILRNKQELLEVLRWREEAKLNAPGKTADGDPAQGIEGNAPTATEADEGRDAPECPSASATPPGDELQRSWEEIWPRLKPHLEKSRQAREAHHGTANVSPTPEGEPARADNAEDKGRNPQAPAGCRRLEEEIGEYLLNGPNATDRLRAEIESHTVACPQCRRICLLGQHVIGFLCELRDELTGLMEVKQYAETKALLVADGMWKRYPFEVQMKQTRPSDVQTSQPEKNATRMNARMTPEERREINDLTQRVTLDGDAESWGKLYALLYPRALAYALTQIPDREEAKGMVQWTFALFWIGIRHELPPYPPPRRKSIGSLSRRPEAETIDAAGQAFSCSEDEKSLREDLNTAGHDLLVDEGPSMETINAAIERARKADSLDCKGCEAALCEYIHTLGSVTDDLRTKVWLHMAGCPACQRDYLNTQHVIVLIQRHPEMARDYALKEKQEKEEGNALARMTDDELAEAMENVEPAQVSPEEIAASLEEFNARMAEGYENLRRFKAKRDRPAAGRSGSQATRRRTPRK